LSLSNDHPLRRPHESLMRLREVTCRAPGRTHWSATTPALHCCAVSACSLLHLSRPGDHWSATNPINRSIYNFCPCSLTWRGDVQHSLPWRRPRPCCCGSSLTSLLRLFIWQLTAFNQAWSLWCPRSFDEVQSNRRNVVCFVRPSWYSNGIDTERPFI